MVKCECIRETTSSLKRCHECYTLRHMKRLALSSLLFAVPLTAFALDYTDVSSRYNDQPFSKAEAAGISVLTNIGAVSGNPDGTFAAERTLNRAEFLKIAYESNDRVLVSSDDADSCFPDVRKPDWFSKYVCLAKERGDIEGYPDGMFHPERSVNYVEAIKILVELFDYSLPEPAPNERWAWYTGYWKAADEHDVLLPMDLAADVFLTRGQMARLTAAFLAEDAGELSQYRDFEKGKKGSSSSSRTSSVSSGSGASNSATSSVSSVSSTSSVSSSAQSSVLTVFSPSISRFLVAGTTTPVILDGLFSGAESDGDLYRVELELQREIVSIDRMMLVDQYGRTIVELLPQTYSNQNHTKWRVEVNSGTYMIPKNTSQRLGIRITTDSYGGGSTSNELFELKTLSLWVVERSTGASRQIVPTETHYPMHQTSFGRITSVRNTLATSMTVPQGQGRTLGTFAIMGMASTGAALDVKSLTFTLQTTDVSVSGLRITGIPGALQSDCGTETTDGKVVINCDIPPGIQRIGTDPLVFSITANLTVAAAKNAGMVQLIASSPGGLTSLGAVRWTDQSSTFNWIESDVELDSGPVVTVTK